MQAFQGQFDLDEEVDRSLLQTSIQRLVGAFDADNVRVGFWVVVNGTSVDGQWFHD